MEFVYRHVDRHYNTGRDLFNIYQKKGKITQEEPREARKAKNEGRQRKAFCRKFCYMTKSFVKKQRKEVSQNFKCRKRREIRRNCKKVPSSEQHFQLNNLPCQARSRQKLQTNRFDLLTEDSVGQEKPVSEGRKMEKMKAKSSNYLKPEKHTWTSNTFLSARNLQKNLLAHSYLALQRRQH